MSKFPLVNIKMRSQGAEDVPLSVQADLMDLAKRRVINAPLSAMGSVLIPTRGSVYVTIVSHIPTVSSTGSDNNVISVTRNGQPGPNLEPIITDTVELEAWRIYGLGPVDVSRGDVLKIDIAVTGSPTTTLSETDFTILCEWRI